MNSLREEGFILAQSLRRGAGPHNGEGTGAGLEPAGHMTTELRKQKRMNKRSGQAYQTPNPISSDSLLPKRLYLLKVP